MNKRQYFHMPCVRWHVTHAVKVFTHELKSMSEAQPLLFHEDFKPADGAVVAVQHEHGEGRQLSRAVPAVTAVNHHGCLS